MTDNDWPNIPGYRIESEIGHGGMATVYMAMQESLERQVAIKVMATALAADRSFSARFLKEARTAARLQHPGIVAIYDAGVVGHHHYIAMELVGGGELKDHLRRGALPPEQAVRLIMQIAEALAYAHDKGFVHRDVKPENILFRENGHVVLTDFGIARSMGSGTRMTGTGMSIGTPHYMSPEQARGQNVDGRSDLYALGVLFYEMLIGQVPFDARDSFAIGLMHINEAIPALPDHLACYQPVLDRLLAKQPEQRYQNAAGLIQALIQAEAEPALRRSQRSTRRVIQTPEHPVSPVSSATAARTSKVAVVRKGGSGPLWALGGALLVTVLGVGGWYLTRDDLRPVAGGSIPPLELSSPPQQIAEGQRILPTSQPHVTERTVAEPELQPRSLAPAEPTWDFEGAPLTRSQILPRLLARAENSLEANRLMVPAGNNALEDYRLVLEIDPGNADAQTGISRIAQRYLELAEFAIAEDNLDRADSLLSNARTLNADQAALNGLETDLQARRSELAAIESRRQAALARQQPVPDSQEQLIRPVQDVEAREARDEGTMATSRAVERSVDRTEVAEADDQLDGQRSAITSRVIIRPGAVFRDCANCPEMIVLPAGTFQMGSPGSEPERHFSEGPQREVRIQAFAMARTELTFAEWEACVSDGGCRHRPHDQGWGGGNRPVINVSWNDAQEYVRWLSRQTGETYRLPSEAEWEYAARAGTTTRFNTGDCITTSQANFDGNRPAQQCPEGRYHRRTFPVSSFEANAFGLHDMHGNVWEWVQDCWNRNYRGAPIDGSAWMTGDCSQGVLRGGGWNSGGGGGLRSALRVNFSRDFRNGNAGFRVARTVTP